MLCIALITRLAKSAGARGAVSVLTVRRWLGFDESRLPMALLLQPARFKRRTGVAQPAASVQEIVRVFIVAVVEIVSFFRITVCQCYPQTDTIVSKNGWYSLNHWL